MTLRRRLGLLLGLGVASTGACVQILGDFGSPATASGTGSGGGTSTSSTSTATSTGTATTSTGPGTGGTSSSNSSSGTGGAACDSEVDAGDPACGVLTTKANCGACGHSCGSAFCTTDGFCPPDTVAQSPLDIEDLTLDGATGLLAWAGSTPLTPVMGSIFIQTSTDASTQKLFHTAGTRFSHLTFVGAYLYWSVDDFYGHVQRLLVSEPGGVPDDVFKVDYGTPFGFAVAGSQIYVNASEVNQGGTILTAPLVVEVDGGKTNATTLFGGISNGNDLLERQGFLVWTTGGQAATDGGVDEPSTVSLYDLDAGSSRLFAHEIAANNIWRVQSYGTRIYWSSYAGVSRQVVGETTPELVWPFVAKMPVSYAFPGPIAIDATGLYIADPHSMTVYELPLRCDEAIGTQKAFPLYTNVAGLSSALAIDDTHAYFASGKTLYRVLK